MAEPRRLDNQRHNSSLSQLISEIGRIDLSQPLQIADALVQAYAGTMATDKVSLLIYDASTKAVEVAVTNSNDQQCTGWTKLGSVAQYAASLGHPMFIFDISNEPGVVPARPGEYKTDAVALLPLINEGPRRAILCLSNLCTQQILLMENSIQLVELLVGQSGQLLRHFLQVQDERKPEATVQSPELSMLNAFITKLSKSGDSAHAIGEFCRGVSGFAPVDALILHYGKHDSCSSLVYKNSSMAELEVEKHFLEVASEWRRRTRATARLRLKDAAVIGPQAESTGSDGGQKVSGARTISLPILIDGELFGLLGIVSSAQEWESQQVNQLANILLYFLGLSLKKSMLMSQNQDMNTVDSLTGLINEKRFFEMMEREFDRSARYKVPLSILFVDVDHFKDVNETYGFEAGDYILKEISMIIVENIRNTDFCSRYSGERFVVVLPDTHNSNSEVLANRLRRYVENHSFQIPSTNVFAKVTVSIGVASYLEHSPSSMAQFIEFADTALYFAKRNGRNQVVNYSYILDLMIGDTGHQS